MRQRVLICGGSGFIGYSLVKHLAQNDNYEVLATYHNTSPLFPPNVIPVAADLCDKKQVDELLQGVDILIQAAATTSGANIIATQPYLHVTDNAVMNSLIFRSAFEQKLKQVIFFSCTVMYQSSDTPLKESDFDANQDLYPNYFGVGSTKVYLEKMCDFFSRISSTKFTAIRHSNVYGPNDKFDPKKAHVCAATINKVMHAESEVAVWGDGTEGRDLLYIDDLVDFVTAAMNHQKQPYELVNVGSGHAITVANLVKTIISASGKDLEITYDRSKPTFKTTVSLDCQKAKDVFGWTPKVDLEEGIKRTLDWYRRHRL